MKSRIRFTHCTEVFIPVMGLLIGGIDLEAKSRRPAAIAQNRNCGFRWPDRFHLEFTPMQA
jgi:hypothetical protein